MEDAGWDPPRARAAVGRRTSSAVLRFAATEVVPRLARTTDELDRVLHALDGGFVPAGPSARRCAG
jgi:cobaltochelatase CobN